VGEQAEWFVWSNQRRAFWRPGAHGYTTLTYEAGRYSKSQADRICAQANLVPSEPPNEVALLAPDDRWVREQFGEAANKYFGP
jgi:hypothetical protein